MIVIIAKYENEIINATSGIGTYRPARLTFQTKAIRGAIINNLPYPSIKLKNKLKESILYGFSFSDKVLVNRPQIRLGKKYEKNKDTKKYEPKNEIQFIEEAIHKTLFLGVILKNNTFTNLVEETLEGGIRLGTKTALKKPLDIMIYENIKQGKMESDTLKITPVPEEQFNYDQFIEEYKITRKLSYNFYYHSFSAYDVEDEKITVKHYIEPYTKASGSVWELTPFPNSLITANGYLLPDDIIEKLPKTIRRKTEPSRILV